MVVAKQTQPPSTPSKTALFPARTSAVSQLPTDKIIRITLGVMRARETANSPSAANAQRMPFLPTIFMLPVVSPAVWLRYVCEAPSARGQKTENTENVIG